MSLPLPIAIRPIRLSDESAAYVRSVRLPKPDVPAGTAIEVFLAGCWIACVVTASEAPTLHVQRLSHPDS